MSVYRTILLAFASLLPIALVLPATASTTNKGSKSERYIGGPFSLEGCYWYNFHQSISLWPVYTNCDGKTKAEWRAKFHQKSHPGNFSDNAQALMAKSNQQNHTDVYIPGHIRFEIDQHYDKAPCGVFNYIQSRHRTPLYLQCKDNNNNKTHRASYGMYSANDYLKPKFVGATKSARIQAEKAWEAGQTGNAPDVPVELKKITRVTKEVNGKHHTMSACQWSNFFQSLAFLPRYINFETKGADPHLKNYEKFANLNKITFGFSQGTSHTNKDFFDKEITLAVGDKTVTAKACVWYNLVQTEVRWPMYRKCSATGKVLASPAPDLMVIHNLPYKN